MCSCWSCCDGVPVAEAWLPPLLAMSAARLQKDGTIVVGVTYCMLGSKVGITERVYGVRSLRPRGALPMLVAGLRLATLSCIRKVALGTPASRRSSLGGFIWSRNMADSGKAAAAGAEGQPPVVKTEKQLKKEAQKNAKLAKYNEKMAKQKAQGAAGEVTSISFTNTHCLSHTHRRRKRNKSQRSRWLLSPTTSLPLLGRRKVRLP